MMLSTAVITQFRELRTIAENSGVASAIEALSIIVPPPSGYDRFLLLPATIAAPEGATELRKIETNGESLTLWRTVPDGHADGGRARLWWLGITWLRLGLSEQLLALASTRLRERRVGDQATINLSPVRLVIADAVLAHSEARAVLESADGMPSPAALTLAGGVLDRSTRLALGLFGAAGYLDDAPGRLARCVELLGHIEGDKNAD